MDIRSVQITCTIGIILLHISSGCVAPPKGTASSSSSGSTGNIAVPTMGPSTEISVAITTGTPYYVTMKTPYGETTTPAFTPTPAVFPVTTTIPDAYITIYGGTQVFAYNKTAFSFDLKNLPMLIDFSVKPVNITGSNVNSSRAGGHGDQTVNNDYFSPISWYQVTVRDK